MPKLKLTDTLVEKLALPKNGNAIYWDDWQARKKTSEIAPGFGVRVTSSGVKTFIVKYRAGLNRETGKPFQRKQSLGRFPATNTMQAIRRAKEHLNAAADGGDLIADRERDALAGRLVGDVAKEWLEQRITGLSDERAIRSWYRNDIAPAIGRMRVEDVRRGDVLKLVEKKAETAPMAAGKVLIYARQLMEFAHDRDYIVANPIAGLKPKAVAVRGVKNPLASRSRKRVLDADEIVALWKADKGVLRPQIKLALQLILATGQRPGEVSGMSLDEIEGRWWTIPADRRGKTETENEVYLTDTALELIEEAKAELSRLRERRNASASGRLFETGVGGVMADSTLPNAVRKNRDELKNKNDPKWGHWTPHDLRRSVKTGMSEAGVLPHVSELVLGHVLGGIEGVYDQSKQLRQRQAAAEAWERRLRAIVEGRDPNARDDNVVQMAQAQ